MHLGPRRRYGHDRCKAAALARQWQCRIADFFQAVETEVSFKRAALVRIREENEKNRQNLMAIEAERIKHGCIRQNLIMLSDSTGCLFKRTTQQTLNGVLHTSIIWQVTERVSCILLVPNEGDERRSRVAVFLKTAAERVKGDLLNILPAGLNTLCLHVVLTDYSVT